MIYAIFPKMVIPKMTIFVKNFINYIKSEFVKIQEFFIKNDTLVLEMKIGKFLGIHPMYKLGTLP